MKPVEQFLAALVEVSATRHGAAAQTDRLTAGPRQYGLQTRQKPNAVLVGAEFVQQDGRDDVGFRVLSREQSELIASGVDKSKLFTGW